jgi:hypothetical protein
VEEIIRAERAGACEEVRGRFAVAIAYERFRAGAAAP